MSAHRTVIGAYNIGSIDHLRAALWAYIESDADPTSDLLRNARAAVNAVIPRCAFNAGTCQRDDCKLDDQCIAYKQAQASGSCEGKEARSMTIENEEMRRLLQEVDEANIVRHGTPIRHADRAELRAFAELVLRTTIRDSYRCEYNGGTCERQACKASQRCHARTNAALVIGSDARIAELAAIQRLAMAGESGEVSASQACGEVAQRLGHLYSAP